jgi:hypothetical protein
MFVCRTVPVAAASIAIAILIQIIPAKDVRQVHDGHKEGHVWLVYLGFRDL